MKKVIMTLTLTVGALIFSPYVSSAAIPGSTSLFMVASSSVTLIKHLNGSAVVKKYLKYEIEDGNVYVISGGKRHLAHKSNLQGYDYYVDLGGSNNIWYFNL